MLIYALIASHYYVIYVLILIFIMSSSPVLLFTQHAFSQSFPTAMDSNQTYVTYHKQSNFVHEYDIPALKDKGLKGITTDSWGNVWFYHATNKTSLIMRFSPSNNTFAFYPVTGRTVADNAVINLAGGQLLVDNSSSYIWFSDARTNSLGQFDIKNKKMQLFQIPTNNSGIMGLALSPDGKSLWFTEIIGNKIGALDFGTKKITEYPTGDNTGPTLLTFDSKGLLWVTLSYSNNILRAEPWLLLPESKSMGMSTLSLSEPDFFSPFGIAITKFKDGIERIFLSDHGSSRVIVANIDSELKNYTSYWTSPSKSLPMSLPSQIVLDKSGDIYFLEHGGNKIAKISQDGVMTEFEIPTGPLATSVFITVSEDAKRVWFTEWASNKIAYLDNTARVPVNMMVVRNNQTSTYSDNAINVIPIALKENETLPIGVTLTRDRNKPLLLLVNDTELSVVGMTDSGLRGLTYTSNPQTIDLVNQATKDAEIKLKVERSDAVAGHYTVMIRASFLEKDGLVLSLLYPVLIELDVPARAPEMNKIQNFQQSSLKNTESMGSSESLFRDIIRIGAIGVVVALIGYLIYHNVVPRIRFRKRKT